MLLFADFVILSPNGYHLMGIEDLTLICRRFIQSDIVVNEQPTFNARTSRHAVKSHQRQLVGFQTEPVPQVDTMAPKYLFWIQMTTVCRHVVFPVIVGLLCVTTSCRSSSNGDAPSDTTQSAAEYVAQAEQLYAQRENLMRLRQGIVSLRQAVTVDPGDYEAAWRL